MLVENFVTTLTMVFTPLLTGERDDGDPGTPAFPAEQVVLWLAIRSPPGHERYCRGSGLPYYRCRCNTSCRASVRCVHRYTLRHGASRRVHPPGEVPV